MALWVFAGEEGIRKLFSPTTVWKSGAIFGHTKIEPSFLKPMRAHRMGLTFEEWVDRVLRSPLFEEVHSTDVATIWELPRLWRWIVEQRSNSLITALQPVFSKIVKGGFYSENLPFFREIEECDPQSLGKRVAKYIDLATQWCSKGFENSRTPWGTLRQVGVDLAEKFLKEMLAFRASISFNKKLVNALKGVDQDHLFWVSDLGEAEQLIRSAHRLAKEIVPFASLANQLPLAQRKSLLRATLLALKTAPFPPMALSSLGELINWLAEQGYYVQGLEPEENPSHDYEEGSPIARALDRLAQRNRDWAISQSRSEYQRGLDISGLMLRVLQALEKIKGLLVIHGRDCELVFQLAKKIRPKLARRMRYVLSPRVLTVYADKSEELSGYYAYLERIVPKTVPQTHIDTGFAGSVPMWFKQRGWNVRRIALISSTSERMALLGKESLSEETREIVLYDLEYSAQRLVELDSRNGERRAPGRADRKPWGYSLSAPGFWARLYGVIDGIKGSEKTAEAKRAASAV
ncbi:MAG: hypothetical protein KatS3mg087_1346 [Patescibacteria group bacterium]|nr:MAG: hypothetical protein KatS3mg087_1346 [Patescibacteria group bacterium]